MKKFKRCSLEVECKEFSNTNEYQKFIDFAFGCCDLICLAYNKSLEDFNKSKWNFLKDSVVDTELTSSTPVTDSLGMKYLLLYLSIDEVSKKWLKERNNIYDFLSDGDEWLEDLCFIKNNTVVFASCTHEKFCHMSNALYKLYRK